MSRVPSLRRPFLPAVTLAALLMAGCGGDDDDGGEEAEVVPAPEPAELVDAPDIEGLSGFSIDSAEHRENPLDYEQVPPTGGPHFPRWRNCGFSDEPVPDAQAVHSLEHGAVWITFDPDLPDAQRDTLEEIADSGDYVLVSPYPDLPAPVVASAWGVQLALDGADDPRLAQFVDYYSEGPQTPEPGAPCDGGIG